MTLAKNFTANATPAEGDFIPSWLAAEGSGSERKTTLAQLRTALFGTSSYAIGDILYASSSTALAKLADVATGNVLRSGGLTTAPAWGKVDVTTDITGTQPAANGGTGIASYAVGDILYASGATALSKLADVATGNVLTSGGVTTAPAWGKAVLTTHVSGVLPEANGGTNQSTYTQGDILYASASNTLSKLAKNVTATRSLTNTGTNNAPAWAQVDLTTGVTGTTPAVNGGTGNASYAVGDLLQASGATALTPLAAVATGKALISGGVTTASTWGKIGLSTHVSGTLPETSGGTGLAAYTIGDIIYASGTNILDKLPKNTSATRYLSNTGVSNIPAWAQVDLTTGVTGTLPVANGGTGLTTGTLKCRLATTFDPASATLQDVTGMSFAVTNNHYYDFEISGLFRTTTATIGPNFGFTKPTGGLLEFAVWTQAVASGTQTTGVSFYEAISGTSATNVQIGDAPALNTSMYFLIKGVHQPGADGTLQFQFANESGTTACTLRAGCVGRLTDYGT